MASSENGATIDTRMLRPPVTDSWLTEFFTRDADSITKALHKSLSQDNNLPPFTPKPDVAATAAATPTVSSLSGSDQESVPRRCPAPPPSGKITKRKSRASKSSLTTFITADAANFRQMVQQITGGVRFGGCGVPIAPVVLKQEPQSATGLIGASLPVGAGCLPTLDTSAFLLDHQQQQVGGGPGTGLSGPAGPPLTALDSHAASFPSAGLDFDAFSSFPTLESWKVM